MQVQSLCLSFPTYCEDQKVLGRAELLCKLRPAGILLGFVWLVCQEIKAAFLLVILISISRSDAS